MKMFTRGPRSAPVRSFTTAVAAMMLAASAVTIGAGPAHAVCDWSYYWKLGSRDAKKVKVYKGESIYNNTKDPVERTVSSTITRTHNTTRSWEVGAEAGVSWKVLTAKVHGKYGRSSTVGVSKSTTVADKMTIRPGHSGWMQANVWKKDYVASYRKIAPHCGDHLVARGVYHDAFKNAEAKTKRGRVDW